MIHFKQGTIERKGLQSFLEKELKNSPEKAAIIAALVKRENLLRNIIDNQHQLIQLWKAKARKHGELSVAS